MDSNPTAPEVARELGLSLPAVHRLLDKHGVPSFGKGATRAVPRELLTAARHERGAVPVVPSGFTKSQVKVLAALSRAPFGLRSARAVAARAGISPMVASRELKILEAQGFAREQDRTVAAGRARVDTFWTTNLATWSTEVMLAVNSTVPPQREDVVRKQAARIPQRFAHLFWNADFSTLDMHSDGSFIAGRLLTSPNIEAWVWTMENLAPASIDSALIRRGIPAAARALVSNWRAHA